MNFIPCLTCAKSFDSIEDLRQHQEATYHYKGTQGHEWNKLEMLHGYFNAFYEEHVLVLRDDQRKSRKAVQKCLQNAKKSFCSDHDFRSIKIVPAGSTATQTKVKRADEYDFNLILDYKHAKFEESKNVFYNLQPSKYKLDYLGERRQCYYNPRGTKIPPGYVAIRSREDIYIIPRRVQEELYKEVQKFTTEYDSNDLCKTSHGPAMTVRIRPPSHKHTPSECKDTVDHDIFVDFAACIKADKDRIGVHKYGWPRLETKQCLSPKQIEKILNAEIYLVPKHNLFWYVSFSDAAKVLLRCIDSANTCRRKCHKILKTDFLRWHSEESLPGISTFIFKNHLFWFNEKLSVDDREEFWKDSNIGRCYTSLLLNLAKCLECGILKNYFNVNENILEKKDKDVLYRLSVRIRKRVQELYRIYVE